jgi:hypothetical protein
MVLWMRFAVAALVISMETHIAALCLCRDDVHFLDV